MMSKQHFRGFVHTPKQEASTSTSSRTCFFIFPLCKQEALPVTSRLPTSQEDLLSAPLFSQAKSFTSNFKEDSRKELQQIGTTGGQ
ncbi:hypothetical protein ACQJBY_015496 [Aegilops geniculata]